MLDLTPKTDIKGLYQPSTEHDACGLGFVASLRSSDGGEAIPTREIVDNALEVLLNLNHRGAVGAEENTGDGAGILTSIPDEFLRKVFNDVKLPEQGSYAVGTAFLPTDLAASKQQTDSFADIVKSEGLSILATRDLSIDDSQIGPTARASMPIFRQYILVSDNKETGIELERKTYRVRKKAEHTADLYFASLSTRTITYKGMLTTKQLPGFFKDLSDPDFKAKIALVHSRFSTNTFPSWPLAQPMRYVAHNGEINTIQGNRNWLKARQGRLQSELLGEIDDLLPILTLGNSDSGSFDECLELLHLSGRSLPHSVLMMMPQAWENDENMDPKLKAFYQYNSTLLEAWDGPASLSFTDGDIVGAVLDRNGLRPGRFWETDDFVVMASESGVLADKIPNNKIRRKGRLEPGKMLLVDTKSGRVIENDEIKAELANQYAYDEWVGDNLIYLSDLPEREHVMFPPSSVYHRQNLFGYTEEELKVILTPMANNGGEPLGAMGTDTPIAVLSNRSRLLFDYFTQNFAQVTNPPLDSVREKIVTSIASAIGPEPNLLEDRADHAKKLFLPFPVIDNDDLAKIQRISNDVKLNGSLKGEVISALYDVMGSGKALETRIDEIFDEVDRAIANGANFIILSDRDSGPNFAPIPSLLITSAVQHHLIRQQTRTQVSLLIEAGDVRETHHIALLIGYGAAAVNPYLAMETVEVLAHKGYLNVSAEDAVKNLINALGNGVLKIMSKMGISTIMSYRGSQIFEAVGLGQELVDKYFTGTASRIGGIDLDAIAREVEYRHAVAYPAAPTARSVRRLRTGGEYKWRRTGEKHLWNPESIFWLQQATKNDNYHQFKKYSQLINDQATDLMTIRGLFSFKDESDTGRKSIDISEVESVESIVKRFSTGAMSYGSISKEAHETLAIAMNQIGARSNSGEGGEESDRLVDDERRSRIRQVASGRFGVTADYLATATDLQIKLIQGAKPGEGGHLPGEKVYPWIAQVRHSTPGIDLVSPPPHHDIYSIEDLAQLIYDLKMSNPHARIHVKLGSELGVGTVAAGVTKAKADVVLISGHDGGTGAAPLSSIKHAGTPWEIGLSEAQQTLVANDLRDRVVLQCDGQLKTGRDVIIAALLGAEEFGFATAPLVSTGCVMMRVCNKNTCPVGVATQDPELRSRYTGKPKYVINFMMFIAKEVRELLAELGFRSLDEAIGHSEVLNKRQVIDHYKIDGLDLEDVLEPAHKVREDAELHLKEGKSQLHNLQDSIDNEFIKLAAPTFKNREKVTINSKVNNVNRSVGTLLGHVVTKTFGATELEDDTINLNLTGVGGQSLGAFLPKGVTITLTGDTNDYTAKGLSGGKVIVRQPEDIEFDPTKNVIAGNVLGFGATFGVGYFDGLVGERFAVRNSGATFVSTGTGDHTCEYMTGGTVVVLGKTGRNFGAGFLGGTAYILDLNYDLVNTDAIKNEQLSFEKVTDIDANEEKILRDIITDFVNLTGSNIGNELLSNWSETKKRLTKVIPKKYKIIRDIENPSANWEKVLEVANG